MEIEERSAGIAKQVRGPTDEQNRSGSFQSASN